MKRRLAEAADVPDFDRAELQLSETARNVRAIFQELLAPASSLNWRSNDRASSSSFAVTSAMPFPASSDRDARIGSRMADTESLSPCTSRGGFFASDCIR